jgi:Zn-dependent peptidase ImmA (M78 family)
VELSAPLQNLRDLPTALAAAGLDDDAHRAAARRARAFLLGYARLEKGLIGEVPLLFPDHLLGMDLPDDPLEAGRALAARERERLGEGEEALGDLAYLLDRQGLKVYRLELPADSPLEGFTLFDRYAGPALVVNRALGPAEADAVLARLYGHFLVDHDPYRIRLVLRGAVPREAEDLRAFAFAAAFLVPVDGVDRYLEALGSTDITDDTVHQLAVYFETDWRTIAAQLLSLRRLEAGDVAGMMERLGKRHGAAPEVHTTERLPERYVRLALEAHARGRFGTDRLAVLLETDPASAASLASRFRLEAPEEEDDDAEDDAGDVEDLDA